MGYNGFLPTGFSSSQSIYPVGEADVFTTTYIAGLTYSVRASGSSSGGGSLADPSLELQNSSGTRLLFNDDMVNGVNRDAQLVFRVSQTTDYRLVVREMGNNATGTYTLSNSLGYGTQNADSVTGSNNSDGVAGQGGNDSIWGLGGSDRLYGGDGADRLIGGTQNDLLVGGNGNDSLWGQSDDDVLAGNQGADRLIGGTGADRFVFTAASDSGASGIDTILGGDGAVAMEGIGVAGGDVIDLSQIDANAAVSGNQAFSFATSSTDLGVGKIWFEEINGATIVRGNTDYDAAPEFTLVIWDGAYQASQYRAADFIF